MEQPWVQIFLDVPRETWRRSLEFWSAATGWSSTPPRGEAGQFATLVPARGPGWVRVQAVDGPPRVHLDLDAAESPCGATTLDRSDPLRVLDQVCIDIPGDHWEDEVAFWRDLTGRELTKGGEPEFAFLGAAGAVRILLQRLDETGGSVRAHVDLAVADRPGETERHLALGAEVVGVFDWWTVLRAPDGHTYCLTDRDPATGEVRRRSP